MEAIYSGLLAVASFDVVFLLAIGVLIGIVAGILPGVGPAVIISVLLPMTYGFDPVAGLSLLLGIYCGAWYGGAVPAILANTPGTPASVVTCWDGYPMTKRGEAPKALAVAFSSSFVGGVFSVLVLMLLAPQLAKFTSLFGAPEFTICILSAFVLVVMSYRNNWAKAMTMICLGLFISTVGLDPNTLGQRFTFGTRFLMNGLPLVPIVIGVFGVAQALTLLTDKPVKKSRVANSGHVFEAFRIVLSYPVTLLRSSAIGAGIGMLPGIGVVMATFFSYLAAQKTSDQPEQFGTGHPEGIVASEASNNAVTGAAMIPVLTLGIPGDAITALMMSVFIIHNVAPGPLLFLDRPDIVYGIFFSMLIINIVAISMVLSATKYLARIIEVPPAILAVLILALCFIGSYSLSNSLTNVWIAIGAGGIAYILQRLNYPPVGMVLGLILGALLEERLRQSLSISDGSYLIFLTRPISAVLLILLLLAIANAIWRSLRKGREKSV